MLCHVICRLHPNQRRNQLKMGTTMLRFVSFEGPRYFFGCVNIETNINCVCRSQKQKPQMPNKQQLMCLLCVLGDCTVLKKYFLPSFFFLLLLQMSFIGLFWSCTWCNKTFFLSQSISILKRWPSISFRVWGIFLVFGGTFILFFKKCFVLDVFQQNEFLNFEHEAAKPYCQILGRKGLFLVFCLFVFFFPISISN